MILGKEFYAEKIIDDVFFPNLFLPMIVDETEIDKMIENYLFMCIIYHSLNEAEKDFFIKCLIED